MIRFTRKYNKDEIIKQNLEADCYDYKVSEEDYTVKSKQAVQGVLNKLGQLEDIEYELSIDLVTLFEALKNGIYDKTENRNVLVSLIWHNYLKELVLFYDDSDPYYNGCYRFKDYGKTWALTKEELADE